MCSFGPGVVAIKKALKICKLPKGVEIVVKSPPVYTVEVRSENAEKDLNDVLSRLQAVFKDQGMEIKIMS